MTNQFTVYGPTVGAPPRITAKDYKRVFEDYQKAENLKKERNDQVSTGSKPRIRPYFTARAKEAAKEKELAKKAKSSNSDPRFKKPKPVKPGDPSEKLPGDRKGPELSAMKTGLFNDLFTNKSVLFLFFIVLGYAAYRYAK